MLLENFIVVVVQSFKILSRIHVVRAWAVQGFTLQHAEIFKPFDPVQNGRMCQSNGIREFVDRHGVHPFFTVRIRRKVDRVDVDVFHGTASRFDVVHQVSDVVVVIR